MKLVISILPAVKHLWFKHESFLNYQNNRSETWYAWYVFDYDYKQTNSCVASQFSAQWKWRSRASHKEAVAIKFEKNTVSIIVNGFKQVVCIQSPHGYAFSCIRPTSEEYQRGDLRFVWTWIHTIKQPVIDEFKSCGKTPVRFYIYIACLGLITSRDWDSWRLMQKLC